MSEDENNGEEFEISCSLGTLTLSVSGNDEEWVRETFDEVWAERLAESEEMSEALREELRSLQ